MCRAVKILNHLMHKFPAEVKQGDTVPSCFSSQAVPFCGLFTAVCSAFLPFLVVILPFKIIAPKHSAKVLSSVLKIKKAVMCLMEYVLDKF